MGIWEVQVGVQRSELQGLGLMFRKSWCELEDLRVGI